MQTARFTTITIKQIVAQLHVALNSFDTNGSMAAIGDNQNYGLPLINFRENLVFKIPLVAFRLQGMSVVDNLTGN